jgi:hypothetical protein
MASTVTVSFKRGVFPCVINRLTSPTAVEKERESIGEGERKGGRDGGKEEGRDEGEEAEK